MDLNQLFDVARRYALECRDERKRRDAEFSISGAVNAQRQGKAQRAAGLLYHALRYCVGKAHADTQAAHALWMSLAPNTGVFTEHASARVELGETNDCVVRAYAAAAGVSYEKSHALHALAGRKPRSGMYQHQYFPLWSAEGWQISEPLPHAPRTVRTLLNDRRLRTGTWIVHTARHVLCLKDGVVHDFTSGRQHRVLHVREFTRKGPAIAPQRLTDAVVVVPARSSQYKRVISNIFVDKQANTVLVGRARQANVQDVYVNRWHRDSMAVRRDDQVYVVRQEAGGYVVHCPDGRTASVSGWAEGVRWVNAKSVNHD